MVWSRQDIFLFVTDDFKRRYSAQNYHTSTHYFPSALAIPHPITANDTICSIHRNSKWSFIYRIRWYGMTFETMWVFRNSTKTLHIIAERTWIPVGKQAAELVEETDSWLGLVLVGSALTFSSGVVSCVRLVLPGLGHTAWTLFRTTEAPTKHFPSAGATRQSILQKFLDL